MARAQTYEPETPMTRDEFLAWAEQQPSGRFERIDGIVVAMAHDRASHNRRKRAARDALQRAVSKAGLTSCEAFADGMTVQVENSDFEPACRGAVPGQWHQGSGRQATGLLQAAVGAALPDRLAGRAAHRSPLANAKRPGCYTDFHVWRNQPRSSGDHGDRRGALYRLSSGSGRPTGGAGISAGSRTAPEHCGAGSVPHPPPAIPCAR